MSAILSPCGRYRYRLERDVQFEGKVFAFFGVNPSTADAERDDATVRKWIGFSERLGVRRFIVGNLFAWRATNVRDLARAPDLYGPDYWRHAAQIIADADVLIPCWGSRSKVPSRYRHQIEALGDLLLASGKPCKCFGYTKDWSPAHPLMLPYSTALEPWKLILK